MTAAELRALRVSLNLTQRQMAERIGIGLRSLICYERPPEHADHRPIPQKVALACQAIAMQPKDTAT